MSDPTQKRDRPPGSTAGTPDPNFTMPGHDQPAPQVPPGDAAMAAGMGQAPYAPARDNLNAARAEEHGAPAPSPRPGPKLWIIGGLLLVIVIAAVAYA